MWKDSVLFPNAERCCENMPQFIPAEKLYRGTKTLSYVRTVAHCGRVALN